MYSLFRIRAFDTLGLERQVLNLPDYYFCSRILEGGYKLKLTAYETII
jgi:hypothetical protein